MRWSPSERSALLALASCLWPFSAVGLLPCSNDPAQSLTKSYGDRVLLDGVSWQVSDGERVGLCGPNGAGKTTLLRMLAGLEEPDSGAITRPATLTVGYLPQDGLVHSGQSVVAEVSLAFRPL